MTSLPHFSKSGRSPSSPAALPWINFFLAAAISSTVMGPSSCGTGIDGRDFTVFKVSAWNSSLKCGRCCGVARSLKCFFTALLITVIFVDVAPSLPLIKTLLIPTVQETLAAKDREKSRSEEIRIRVHLRPGVVVQRDFVELIALFRVSVSPFLLRADSQKLFARLLFSF